MTRRQVFLGGSCGATTWRRDVAIPALEAAGVTYFDPQVGAGEWTAERELVDMKAKEEADVLLFVIHETTRGIASIAEVAYLLAAGRPLALSVADVPAGARLDDRPLGEPERADLNRGRLFVRTMAAEHGVPVFESIADATAHAIALARAARPALTLASVRAVLADVSFRDRAFAVEEHPGGFHLRIERAEPDVDTGAPSHQHGRRWLLERDATPSEIVQTALKAVLAWEEHSAREHFRYRGEPVFGPHHDVDRLVDLCQSTRGPAPKPPAR
jgi:hypothetical protein